ncbi:MAG: 5'/3'-nucleotidase SurE [Ardenticatenales bacterium]|nr:5'/3'-nucleotidase SurE [Ardenticatenales bacterium]
MAPHILVTNDDGIDSPGLHALALALSEVGDVTVVAPDRNWSISGHQKTLARFLRADPYELPHAGVRAFAASGSPADCVAMAAMGLLERSLDLVVSGINKGPNLGQDITYSGTVAATFEAAIFGYPAVAVSLDSRDPTASFQDAAQVAARIARRVLVEGLPRHSLLNINVPSLPATDWKGLQVTRLGRRDYLDTLARGVDPSGRPYYWITGEAPLGDIETSGTDIWAVHHGYVSVTPIRLDMTDHHLLDQVRAWNLES